MVSSINNSAQAIQAFGTGMAVTANNVANVESDDFKSSRAVMNEGDNGSVRVTLSQDASQGPLVTGSDGMTKELSNTDLAKEFTGMINFQSGYDANIKAVQAADDMKGTVINMIA
ncbi:FlgG1 [Desulfamplus magnetovallimortis]|uniref:FlgG1 n=1 Tax=Desulfamplus magnetovallimortis TaxID=1246637 RepID=A0A1W1HBQ9_9BACT|nr:flagellar basal body rod C-terminal domain-containing protein [Desulfamplus magnetovallimortis]SLM29927.1 FlgG1 [Desulfamplus magnetovallimortis]